jgi:peptidoglycan hydrolase-like protein with peptidoglycan-binding domain
MKKRALLSIFGAALLVSAAPVVSAASLPGTAQTPSSTNSTKSKKKKTTSSKSKKSAKTKGQTAPTSDRIREIQSALQKDGSYAGDPNGKWDATSVEAMKKYQDKNGLSPTGKIDAVTLNKLGLGSETAGKGAPVPATTSSVSPSDPLAKQ